VVGSGQVDGGKAASGVVLRDLDEERDGRKKEERKRRIQKR
jgi:hypothetical protein